MSTELILRLDDVILGDLHGTLSKGRSKKTGRPRFVVDTELAHTWADLHASQIIRALGDPPLIVPSEVIVGRDGELPLLARVWRTADTKGSAGRLLTWLFMWWIAQSGLGGIHSSFPPGRRRLLYPFVLRQAALVSPVRAEYPDGRFGDVPIYPDGTLSDVPIALPVDARRRLDEHIAWLRERGFIEETELGLEFRRPTNGDSSGTPTTPLFLSDMPRYAFVGEGSNERLTARITTAQTWVGTQTRLKWTAMRISPQIDDSPALEGEVVEGLQGTFADYAPFPERLKGFIYVDGPVLRMLPRLTAKAVLTLLVLSSGSPNGTMQTGCPLVLPPNWGPQARLTSLPPRTLADGTRELIDRGVLTERRRTVLGVVERTVELAVPERHDSTN